MAHGTGTQMFGKVLRITVCCLRELDPNNHEPCGNDSKSFIILTGHRRYVYILLDLAKDMNVPVAKSGLQNIFFSY